MAEKTEKVKEKVEHNEPPWELRTNPVPHIVRVYTDEQGRKCTQFIVGEMNTCGNVHGLPNGELIVKAVNNHEKVVEGLEFFMTALDNNTLIRNTEDDGNQDWHLKMMRFVQGLQKAQQALADAERK